MSTHFINVNAVIRDIEDSGGVIIRGFRTCDELRQGMQRALEEGKKCAFVPSLKTLREFLNTDGFISVMREIAQQLGEHEVLIEPNKYDSMHIFAIAPRR